MEVNEIAPLYDRKRGNRRAAEYATPRPHRAAAPAKAEISRSGKSRIFPLQLERSEGPVLRFFAVAGFEVRLRTPVLPMRAASSPDRRMRRERDRQLGYLDPV